MFRRTGTSPPSRFYAHTERGGRGSSVFVRRYVWVFMTRTACLFRPAWSTCHRGLQATRQDPDSWVPLPAAHMKMITSRGAHCLIHSLSGWEVVSQVSQTMVCSSQYLNCCEKVVGRALRVAASYKWEAVEDTDAVFACLRCAGNSSRHALVTLAADSDTIPFPPGCTFACACPTTPASRGIATRLMRCSQQCMQESFEARYVSLHVRESNRAAFHLYKTTLGYQVRSCIYRTKRRVQERGQAVQAWADATLCSCHAWLRLVL